MEAVIKVSEKRVKKRIEQIKALITQMQADLNKELPDFLDHEKHYFQWKIRIDEKKALIKEEKDELDQLEHFDKFKEKPKPQLVKSISVGVIKAEGKGRVLKNIKWAKYIVPVLEEVNHFMTSDALYKAVTARHKEIESNGITHHRFISAVEKATERFKAGIKSPYFKYKDRIGLTTWSFESVPKAEHLQDFYDAGKTA